jgi:hypothetical protein
MDSDKKVIGKMGWLQIAALLLLLVILPLGSWYYLQTGLDYRLQAREELKPIGELPAFEFQNYDGRIISSQPYEDYLVVGHFFADAPKQEYLDLLVQIHDQYDDRKDVYFMAFSGDTSAIALNKSEQLLRQDTLIDADQLFFLHGTGAEGIARQIKMPYSERGMSIDNNSLLFFADSSIVKGIYDIRLEEDVKKLIKHITLRLHPLEEKDIIFEREQEK